MHKPCPPLPSLFLSLSLLFALFSLSHVLGSFLRNLCFFLSECSTDFCHRHRLVARAPSTTIPFTVCFNANLMNSLNVFVLKYLYFFPCLIFFLNLRIARLNAEEEHSISRIYFLEINSQQYFIKIAFKFILLLLESLCRRSSIHKCHSTKMYRSAAMSQCANATLRTILLYTFSICTRESRFSI